MMRVAAWILIAVSVGILLPQTDGVSGCDTCEVPQNFVLSLNGTVLTASWDAPATQNVSYTLTCSVAGREVLSLNTTMTEVTIGIYKTETNYSCNVYATVFGIDQTATDDQYIITGDSTEPAYLPFIPRLSDENIIATGDDSSQRVHIVPFPYGETPFLELHVGSNGIISFGSIVNGPDNAEFTNSSTGEYLVAPFWDDINIDDGGTISYETFESGYYLEQVNAYIQRQRQNAFQGTWMMNVYYKEVAPYSVSGGDSRRNTFQAILVTDETYSYAVFIYKCGLMEWDNNATIGYSSNGNPFDNHESSSQDIACLNSPDSDWSNVLYQLSKESPPGATPVPTVTVTESPASTTILENLNPSPSQTEISILNITPSSKFNTPPATNSSLNGSTIAGIVVLVVMIVVLSLIIIAVIFIYLRKTRKHRLKTGVISATWWQNTETDSPSKGNIYIGSRSRGINGGIRHQNSLLQQLIATLPRNMMYTTDQLRLSNTIGKGETGLVYKAYLTSSEGTEIVAVKMSKTLFSKVDAEKLMKELTTMLSFKHPNVMPLLGACLEGEIPLIIMPFMSNGTVQEHVKKRKDELLVPEGAPKDKAMSAKKQLLGLCRQIAKGMEYLAENKFVHRDLAARNCMIDEHGVIKVADFGLTEDMYGTNYYRRMKGKTGDDEKVPIRWMPPESIENDIYNEKTDVWAFGVTCWEVFTCGGVPYAGISALSLLTTLRNGERLDKPHNAACTNGIYGVILNCWKTKAIERPKFAFLVRQLSSFLEQDSGYLELTTPTLKSQIQFQREKSQSLDSPMELVEKT